MQLNHQKEEDIEFVSIEVEEDSVIKTGMKLKLVNGQEFDLIVRGDLNCDGKVTLTDLSKFECEKFDVLKCSARSKTLFDTNKKILKDWK